MSDVQNDKTEAVQKLEEAIANGVSLRKISILYTFVMLERFGGNKVHASRALGVDRRSIQRWVKDGSIGEGKRGKSGRPVLSQKEQSGGLQEGA